MTSITKTIAALNDRFRRTLAGGKVVLSADIAALPEAAREHIICKVRAFDTFDAEDDPYGEHDFGAFEALGKTVFWKIDYFDEAMAAGSAEPSDPAVTTRVLTIMFAEEY